jgi:hypothetical protein
MNFDMSTIAEAVAPLKTAGEIVKNLRGLKDSGTSASKISELYGVILAAQGSALSAQASQLSLLQTVRNLEEKISEFETWDREKTRYQLTEVNLGRGSVFAYALKPDAAGSDPIHLLCAKCFEHRVKSPLQATPKLERGLRVHFCPECKTELAFSNVKEPPPRNMHESEYDPFKNV